MLLKSLLFKGIFLLFFTAFFSFSSFGQTPQAGLSSNPVDESDILQLCEGTAVSFTGFQGGLFDAPKSYEFFIVRNGGNLVGQARSDEDTWEGISIGNELLDDDQVFVRAYDRTTAEGGGTSSDSRRIQIISIEPPAPTLISDTPGNTFCNGQEVVFRAFPNTSFNKERESRLPLLISIQGGYEFDLNPYDMGILPRHSFLYFYGVVNRTPRTMVVNLSQEIQMGPIAFGVSQQASKSEQFALNNIGVSASFSVENFDFGLQYNFPFRKQAQVYAPSLFELFVSFNFTAFRRNNRGFFKRLQIDNYF